MNKQGFFKMADVNIGYDIRVNANGAQNTLQGVATAGQQAQTAITQLKAPVVNANSSLFAMNQIVRDLPFGFIAISNNLPILVDQFTALKNTSGGATAALKSMAAGFLGPAGFSIAISAAISLITAWSMSNRGAKKDTEETKEAVKSLTEEIGGLSKSLSEQNLQLNNTFYNQIVLTNSLKIAVGEWGELFSKLLFNANEDAQALLKTLNQLKLKTISQETINFVAQVAQAGTGLSAFTKAELEATRQALNDAQQTMTVTDAAFKANKVALQNISDALGKFSAQKKQANKDIIDSNKAVYEAEKAITDEMSREQQILIAMLKIRGQMENPMAKFGVPRQLSGVNVSEPSKLPDYTKELQQEFSLLIKSHQIAADIIGEEFKSMWTSIFGEANSLLEKFAQRLSQIFLDMAAQRTATALFDMLVPGSGSVLNTIIGGSSGRAINSGGSNVSYVVLDSNVIGTAVTKVLPASQSRNLRLGRGV